jgi:hypothetical protein
MTSLPQDLAWLPEAQILKVCRLPRSTLQSWGRSGLSLAEEAAYDLKALVMLVLLAETRDFLSPKEMVGAWRDLVETEVEDEIVERARRLAKDDRLDLVIDVTYGSLAVAQSDAELTAEVREMRKPRPLVVIDVAEPVYRAVKYFANHANRTSRPKEKAPGRPRSADRVRLLREEAGV